MVNSCSALNCTAKTSKESTLAGISFHIFPKDKELRDKWITALRRLNFTLKTSSTICSSHFEDSCFENSAWKKSRSLIPGSIPTIFNFDDEQGCNKNSPSSIIKLGNLPSYFFSDDPFLIQNATSALSQQVVNFFSKTSPPCEMTNQPLDLSVRSSHSPEGVVPTNQRTESTDDVTSHASRGEGFPLSYTEFCGQIFNNKQQNKRKSYIGDFDEEDMKYESRARRFFKATRNILEEKNAKIKSLQQHIRRIEKKNAIIDSDKLNVNDELNYDSQ